MNRRESFDSERYLISTYFHIFLKTIKNKRVGRVKMPCKEFSRPPASPSPRDTFCSFLHRLKGNLISWNFILNLVYAKCQYKMERYSNFLRCQLDMGKIRHDFCSISFEIIPRYSLRNESSCLKIFSVSPTHRLTFFRYNFFLSFFVFFLPSFWFEGVNRDTWIYDDDVMPLSRLLKVLAV